MLSRGKTILFIIILAGLVLRIWGVGFGLPFQFHQDEPMMVNHALAYGTGDLNPHYFALPPFTSYVLFIAYGILFFAGKIAGMWAGAGEMAAVFFADPSVFYLTGRVVAGVVPGALNVYLTYSMARRRMGEKASLFAAAVMAFSFLNVVNSHYIYVDMFLTAGVVLTFIRLSDILERPSAANYLMCGICAGFAAGAKYNGIILAVPCLFVHLRVSRGAPVRDIIFSGKLWAAAAGAVLTVIVTNPYMILAPGEFLASVSRQGKAFWYTGWTHHFTYSLKEGLGMPIAAAGLAGLFVFSARDRWARISLSFFAIFYVVLVFKSQYFARYVLPVVPLFAVGAGYLIFEYTAERFRFARSGSYAAVVGLLFLFPTLSKSITADMLFSRPDTRTKAAEWIKDNLDKGSALACDSTTFRPALKQPFSQLSEKSRELDRHGVQAGVKKEKIAYMMEAVRDEGEGYPLYFMFEYPEKEGQFLTTTPAIPYSIKSIKDRGIRYIVINEQLDFPVKNEFLGRLRKEAAPAARFSPYKDGKIRRPYDRTATTCLPVKSRELYARSSMGPAMTVYELK